MGYYRHRYYDAIDTMKEQAREFEMENAMLKETVERLERQQGINYSSFPFDPPSAEERKRDRIGNLAMRYRFEDTYPTESFTNEEGGMGYCLWPYRGSFKPRYDRVAENDNIFYFENVDDILEDDNIIRMLYDNRAVNGAKFEIPFEDFSVILREYMIPLDKELFKSGRCELDIAFNPKYMIKEESKKEETEIQSTDKATEKPSVFSLSFITSKFQKIIDIVKENML